MTPDELRQKIKDAQARQDHETGAALDKSQKRSKTDSVAFRAATDLVAGVAVGTFIGYWIDRFFGSTPFGMIIFLFLGFIAGFMNIYRSQMSQMQSASKDSQKTDVKGP